MASYDSDDFIVLSLPTPVRPSWRNLAVLQGGGLVTDETGSCVETNITTPTLTFPTTPIPQYPFQENVHFRTDATPNSDGTEKRLQRWVDEKLSYQMTWGVLTKAEVDILWAFFLSTKGSFYKFSLIDPRDGVTSLGQFRFADDMMTRAEFEYNLYSTGFKIIEVLDDPV